jgi:hypothetical protein
MKHTVGNMLGERHMAYELSWSLTKNAPILFTLAVVGLVRHRIWSGRQFLGLGIPTVLEIATFIDAVPIVCRGRPEEVAFDIQNPGSTTVRNITVQVHDDDAASEWSKSSIKSDRVYRPK